MSSSIDRRTVEMEFNNRQFETGVHTSVNSLENLKKSLKLDGASKGLENVSNAAKTFSLNNVADNVQTITNRFSALGVVGFTVITNLTNSVMNFGKRLVNALAIEPLKQGLQEYETQINAIQTVLANTASKGTTLPQVNAALDELNTYADKTIYNFTEMTKNIGTFTAAGVDLETSVSAIKGIANLAAISGSNSQQAATAMYQLSQALSSGTVKLMDWNSVVNAGMGGQVFQDALKETARAHKINIDQMIKSEGSFRETLQKGWLTSEVLLETLSKFTGDLNADQLKSMGYTQEQIKEIMKLGELANDAATKVKTFSQLKDTLKEAMQSGWSQTWRLIIGDFEEARSLYTEVSDILGGFISASADARNELLKGWKDYGGRTALILGLRNAFEGLMSILKPIKEAFAEFFPPLTSEKLFLLTASFVQLTEKLKINEEMAGKIKRIFQGLTAIFDMASKVIDSLLDPLISLFDLAAPKIGSGLLDFFVNLGDSLVNFNNTVNVGDIVERIIYNITTTTAVAYRKIIEFLNSSKEYYRETYNKISSWLQQDQVKKFFDSLKNTFDSAKKWLTDIFKNVDLSGVDSFFDKINIKLEPLGLLGKMVKGSLNAISKALEIVGPIFFKLSSFIKDIISRLGTNISETMTGLNFNEIFTTINSGILAALLLSLRNFITKGGGVFDGASGLFEGLTGVLDGVRGSLEAWQQSLQAKTLLTIAIAIGILAASIIALSMVDAEKLSTALVAITVMFAELMGSLSVFSKISGGTGATQAAATLVTISVAILILAAAVAIMSLIDMERLQQSLTGIGILLAEIALFMKVVQSNKVGTSQGAGLFALAISLLVLSSAVAILASIDPAGAQQALIVMGAILTGLTLFMKANANSKQIITTAIGLNILGIAMLLFAGAIAIMGSLSWDQIAKGLTAMAGSLFIIAAAIRVMPKNMILIAPGLILIATAMVILAGAMEIMGSMSWEEIARGIAALAGSLLVLALGIKLMNKAIPGAIAMFIVSAALALFVPQLKALGSMSLPEIGRGLLALAGAFIILGLAGLLLGPLVPVLISLAGAMFLFGLATLAVGVGVLAFSAGLAALAISGTAGAAALVSIVTMLIGLIPALIIMLVDAIVQFATLIAEAAPVLAIALGTTLLALIAVIISVIPALVEAILLLVTHLLTALASKLPEILEAGFNIILTLLKGIRDNIAEIVTVAIEIVTNFIDAVATKIPDVIQSAFNLIIAFIDGLATGIDDNIPRILEAVGRLAGAIIEGLVEGLFAGVGAVVDAVKSIAQQAIDAFKKDTKTESPSKVFMELGGFLVDGLTKGLDQNGSKVATAAKNMGDTAVSSMSKALSQMGDALSSDLDMNPTIRPVIDMTDIEVGSKEINKLFGDKSINVAGTVNKLSSIGVGNQSSNINPQTSVQLPQGSSISFTQNNYSPSALSRIEIYRQTRNQLRLLKGLV